MTEKSELLFLLEKTMKSFDFIDFALLFGSVNSGRDTSLSDVDIGIFTVREITLLELGYIISKLEMAIKRKVDVIILNALYKKNAVFANQIIINCNIISVHNEDHFIEYKKKTYLYFLDMKYLNEMMNKSFIQRVDQGKFAEKVHA